MSASTTASEQNNGWSGPFVRPSTAVRSGPRWRSGVSCSAAARRSYRVLSTRTANSVSRASCSGPNGDRSRRTQPEPGVVAHGGVARDAGEVAGRGVGVAERGLGRDRDGGERGAVLEVRTGREGQREKEGGCHRGVRSGGPGRRAGGGAVRIQGHD